MFKKSFLIFVIPFLILSIGTSFAQLKDHAYLLSLNVGYSSVTNNISGNSMSGWGAGGTFEGMMGESDWAFGANITFFSTSDEYSISDVSIAQSFETIGLYLGFKHYVRSLGAWVPYIGLGVGSNFTNRYTTSTGAYTIDGENVYQGFQKLTSISAAVPVGVNWFVSENTFLGLNLTGIWAEKTFLKSNVNLLINLALGFQLN